MKNVNVETKIRTDKSKKVLKEPFYFLKWILKVEIIILIIYFVMGITFNVISDETKFIMKYNIEQIFLGDIENEKYSYEDITGALAKNNTLKKEEKNFVGEVLKQEIEENKNYIDMKTTIKRLKNLQVSYHQNNDFFKRNEEYQFEIPSTEFMRIKGNYNAIFNKMNLYETTENSKDGTKKEESFNFESSNKKVYFHELNHLLTRNTISTAMDTFARNLQEENDNDERKGLLKNISNSIQRISKNIFLETINELFSREYFEVYSCMYSVENMFYEEMEAYNENMVYAYVLAEILPEDTIRTYKFNDNESILISGLLEIDNNINEVYKLITSINLVDVNNKEKLNEQIYKEIHDSYAYFYSKKYNKNMSDDLTILLYFYGTPMQTQEERNKIRSFLEMEEYDEIIKIIPKGYVSKEYKNKHSGVQVEYTKNGNREFIEIKDK